jgi:hypothetical protein
VKANRTDEQNQQNNSHYEINNDKHLEPHIIETGNSYKSVQQTTSHQKNILALTL